MPARRVLSRRSAAVGSASCGRRRFGSAAFAVAILCGGIGGIGVAAPLSATAAPVTPAAAPASAAPAPVVAPLVRLHKPRGGAARLKILPDPAVVPLGVRAVRLAATRAGDPYVWGAEGPHAFDCSGLVMWVYDHLGKNLPRTAGAQYSATRHISHSAMRPGDLVFFANSGGIYHVAIYAGHGWIWAAPYPGKDVEREKLWTNDFLAGHVR